MLFHQWENQSYKSYKKGATLYGQSYFGTKNLKINFTRLSWELKGKINTSDQSKNSNWDKNINIQDTFLLGAKL